MRLTMFGEWQSRAELGAAFDAEEQRAIRSHDELRASVARRARLVGSDPWTTRPAPDDRKTPS